MPPFFSALFIGFCFALPLWPVALLTIQRSIKNGGLSGFFTGIGSSTAEAIYATIAWFWVVFITHFVRHNNVIFMILGALTVAIFGVRILREIPHTDATLPSHKNLFLDAASGFGITIINPLMLALFSVIFVYLEPTYDISRNFFVFEVVLGCFLGSTIWWAILSTGVSHLKWKIMPEKLAKFNTLAGIMMVLFSLGILIKIFIS